MKSVYRMLPLLAVLVALGLWTGAAIAADNPHDGKVVSVANGKLTMTDKEGDNQHSHEVAEDAEITCDGKACRLDELKPGFMVRVTTAMQGNRDVAVKIEARKQ
jgi:hypothetical protein